MPTHRRWRTNSRSSRRWGNVDSRLSGRACFCLLALGTMRSVSLNR